MSTVAILQKKIPNDIIGIILDFLYIQNKKYYLSLVKKRFRRPYKFQYHIEFDKSMLDFIISHEEECNYVYTDRNEFERVKQGEDIEKTKDMVCKLLNLKYDKIRLSKRKLLQFRQDLRK